METTGEEEVWEELYIFPVYALCSRVDVLYSGDIVPVVVLLVVEYSLPQHSQIHILIWDVIQSGHFKFPILCGSPFCPFSPWLHLLWL